MQNNHVDCNQNAKAQYDNQQEEKHYDGSRAFFDYGKRSCRKEEPDVIRIVNLHRNDYIEIAL